MIQLVGVRNGFIVDLHENVLEHLSTGMFVQSFQGSVSSFGFAEQVYDHLDVRVHDITHVVVVRAFVVVT